VGRVYLMRNLGRMGVGALIGGFLVAVLMLPYAAAAGFGAQDLARAVAGSDTLNLDEPAPEVTTLTDDAGKPIAYLFDQNRTWVKFDDISLYVKRAIVSIEDRRFYEHRGVDWRGTARAALGQLQNQETAGGGSTLTQQLMKNYQFLVLAKTDAEKAAAIEYTPLRKLREARMAINLEQTVSKDQILERYLNTVAFAPSVYGIEAAAQYFFGVNNLDLTIDQAAALAAMVNNPNRFNPFTEDGVARVLKRRDLVLDAMVRDGYLSDTSSERAKAQPLNMSRHPKPNGCIAADGSSTNGFFCQYVLDYLRNLKTSPFTDEDLLTGGYTIKTTMNAAAMAAAVSAVSNNANPATEAAKRVADVMAIVQPSTNPSATGRPVMALAANRPYGLDPAQGQTVNRLTTTFAPLGAGSTFKVFTAAVAMEKKVGTDAILDSPNEYTSPIVPAKAFKNFSEGGAETMTLQQALATSPNTLFVQLQDQVGLADVAKMAVRLGLKGYDLPAVEVDARLANLQGTYADQVPQQKIESFTLGVSPVSPLELANVGATLASGGLWCPPTPVAEIMDRDDRPVTWSQTPCEQAVDSRLAASLAQAMTVDVVNEVGTAHASFAAANWGARPAAGKTGTTQDYKSSAFLGFTPYYAGASIVWDYLTRPQPICKNPLRTCGDAEAQAGAGMTGGSVPAKTWADTMVPLHADKDPLPFPPASILYQKGSAVDAIDVVGKTLDEARSLLGGAGYVVPDENIRTIADPRPVRTVIDQFPKSDAVPGGIISLTVSGGPAA
jgi:membrane peptidoglycan carboxypeptidase